MYNTYSHEMHGLREVHPDGERCCGVDLCEGVGCQTVGGRLSQVNRTQRQVDTGHTAHCRVTCMEGTA